MFADKIQPILFKGVATIGRKDIIPKLIDTISWYWADDEGQLYTNKLNNLLYFQESPVNIIGATAMDESMKDDEGT